MPEVFPILYLSIGFIPSLVAMVWLFRDMQIGSFAGDYAIFVMMSVFVLIAVTAIWPIFLFAVLITLVFVSVFK